MFLKHEGDDISWSQSFSLHCSCLSLVAMPSVQPHAFAKSGKFYFLHFMSEKTLEKRDISLILAFAVFSQ